MDEDRLPSKSEFPDLGRIHALYEEAKKLWEHWDNNLETMALEMFRRTYAELQRELALEQDKHVHADLEPKMVWDMTYPFHTGGFERRVFAGRACPGCKKLVILRRKGTYFEICHKCGNDMTHTLRSRVDDQHFRFTYTCKWSGCGHQTFWESADPQAAGFTYSEQLNTAGPWLPIARTP